MIPVTSRNVVPFLSILAIVGAAFYSTLSAEPYRPHLDSVVGTNSTIEGSVIRDPDIREGFIFLTVSVATVDGIEAEGNVLASVDRFSDATYGDQVSLQGKLKKPEPFETDTERTFDYPKYLLAHGVTHTLPFAELEVVAHSQGNPIVASLLAVKHAFVAGIKEAFPEPESALLAGLLLGEKQSLGPKITEAFRDAGVVHIIVLSGYNVALVIKAVMHVAQSFLPRVAAFSVAGVAILAFALMTGASETTIRASLMAGIVLLAQLLNRPSEGLRLLLIAAAVMAIWNPYLVLYDLSYQLSILATLGLILFSDPIARRLPFIPETLALREIVATTIATQVTVLPLLVLSIGSVSIVALAANILVLPAVAPAMLVGFVATLLALVSYALAFPIALIGYGILRYIIEVSGWFGSLPIAAFTVSPDWIWPGLAGLGVTYAAVLFFFLSKRKTLV